MTCEFVRDKNGDLTAIVCTRGRRQPKKCVHCGATARLLCDGRKAEGKTCDAPICEFGCAWRPEKEHDYCRSCAPIERARRAGIAGGKVVELPTAASDSATGVVAGGSGGER